MRNAKDYEILKESILEIIPVGRDNRLPMSHFIESSGLTRREITQILLELRREHPICTTRVSPGGYWLGDEEDMMETMAMLIKTRNTVDKSIIYLTRQLGRDK